ncbi:DUF4406 domain-containing protein [Rhizobium laguerreae]|uniref:PfkB family carbohydrate kinase n=1 Tax=Rhizobium laguerreae TaxID=1076926 RepID=UPI001C90EC85|nr:PfkB family carbohydrate kinase [Rhizobium laguerreae]MBY3464750.1 DUF4406 domain-containing protein [Rhizobium laguerreae]
MTEIDIVGGIYKEKCAFPYWNQLVGSGGRAAMALSGLIDRIRLHSTLSSDEELTAQAIFEPLGVDLHLQSRAFAIEFDYLHTLAVPTITPWPPSPVQLPGVTGDVIIKFGMMECDPRISAKYAIYDPQSAFKPLTFSNSGSRADHLAVVANRGEILRMAQSDSVEDAVKSILASESTEVIVVKDGINGATVYAEGSSRHIPAFKTQNVFALGSGDVFVAAFALAWAINGLSPFDAALFASQSTADYVESLKLPVKAPDLAATGREVACKTGGRIYLAGPFRETGQRMFIDDARSQLQALGMSVFSPIHDIGPGSAEVVVQHDLAAVRQCDAVFAILNGSSPGTVFEVGYARALEKPVFCVAQNMRDVDVKLPKGSGAYLHSDYVSALFQIAWR